MLTVDFAHETKMVEDYLPFSHQLGRVAQVKPFTLQGMKTSILYDDEEEVNFKQKPASRKNFSNAIFDAPLIESKHSLSAFQRLDISKTKNLNDSFNNSVFLNVENTFQSEPKVAKKIHLFKNSLRQQIHTCKLVLFSFELY